LGSTKIGEEGNEVRGGTGERAKTDLTRDIRNEKVSPIYLAEGEENKKRDYW